MRPLSESTARIAGKSFARKHVSLGRIVSQWSDIVGAELSGKVQPVKIHYQFAKRGSGARLDIAASEAEATLLKMQVGVILERLNHLFGDNWIGSIRFVSVPSNQENVYKAVQEKKRKAVRDKPLSGNEESFLSQALEEIEDDDIKAKLESLGLAIIKDERL